MRILRTKQPSFRKIFEEFLERTDKFPAAVEKAVRKILEEVRRNGDRAVLKYTKRFDRFTPRPIEVSRAEIRDAYAQVRRTDLASLRLAAKRIERFHRIQYRKLSSSWKTKEGGLALGEEIRPLFRVGIYVPGGLAAYPSTVLMNAIPARIAGVKEIVMVSPWTGGTANPYTLVAADLAGVKRIFKVGGAQAIAALAYGTKSIPAVDKIVGPGNIYVATAKKLVFGKVGIDMIAGPTEVVIVADETADPDFVASDLLSQAEHDPRAQAILLTDSEKLARAVLGAVRRGLTVVTRNRDEALELADRIAPEHLELQIRNAASAVSKIKNAGAVFIGRWSPVAFGDYLAGPNHVLPTAGTARFSSPLGIGDFLKRSSVIEIKQRSFKTLAPHVIRLAKLEGLTAHAASVEVRLGKGRL
jgi:histidinol dehydrogenase